MKKELGIQLFSVRDRMKTREDAQYTLKKLKEYGYTQVQTAGVPVWGHEAFAEDVKNAGLTVVGTHLGFDLIKDTEECVRVHNILGTTNAGIGGAPSGTRDSIEAVSNFCNEANKAAEALSKYGMKFTYHNHSFEFAKIGNERMIDILVRELDPKYCSFVLDTYWVQNAGGFVNEWIEKLAGRIDILHLKDRAVKGNDGYITELGNGNLNFKSIVKTAEETGVKYFCYEQDGNHALNPLESAKVSAEFFFNELA